MLDPIQTGLLAYGMSGKVFHAPFLSAHPGFALRAVVERHRKQAALDYPGILSHDSAEALLADPAIELVVVCTPSSTHVALAEQALRAGKHVLIEKPVATTVDELQALHALGRQQGRHVLPYQNRRWDSDFQAVRQVVESGELGRILEAHFRYDRYRMALSPKALKETPVPGSGLLHDLGPHLLDQVICLFGRPLGCRKTLGVNRPGSRVDDYFTLHLRYPDGLNVLVSGSLLVADPPPAFVLHGTAGSFRKSRGDVQEAQLKAGTSPRSPGYGVEPAGEAGTLTLVDPAGASKTTRALPTPKGDYMHLFEAAYRTIRHGAAYPVREDEAQWQVALLEQAPTGW